MLYLMLIFNNDAEEQAAPAEERAAFSKGYGELNTFLAESVEIRPVQA